MPLFLDAHCHPSLKHYLFGHSVFSKSSGKKENNYFNIQVTQRSLQKAGINGVITAHYLPEKEVLNDWKTLRIMSPVLKTFFNKYFQKAEKANPYTQTLQMISEFELHIQGQESATIAHTYSELQFALDNNKVFYIHSLEGGHHLGRNLTSEEYGRHIVELKSLGVGLITLSHFYPNDITSPCEGIPPRSKKFLGMRYKPPISSPLTDIGKDIVTKILEAGILLDLTHTNAGARKEIFELNSQRGSAKRPLLFSHTGIRALFNDTKHPDFAMMGPNDDEILNIKECNGVIGIIFMNYWLTGKEERLLFSGNDYGFENILNTIRYISIICGSFDHIAIGTDFDGWTDPPDDYYDSAMLGEFKERLLRERERIGATEADIEKITGQNLLRVLRDGWT